MPEPKMHIIEEVKVPNNPNSRGIAIIFKPDPTGFYWINKIDMKKGEVEFCYHNHDQDKTAVTINSYIDSINSYLPIIPLQYPKAITDKYTKKFDILQDKNVAYIEYSQPSTINIFSLICDKRNIYYKVDGGRVHYTESTGINIVNGKGNCIFTGNISADKIAFQNVTCNKNEVLAVVGEYNKFPCTNMVAVLQPGSSSRLSSPEIKMAKHFRTELINNDFIFKEINSMMLIDFNFSYSVASKKSILAVDYDGYNDEKSIKFFDPTDLRYKEVDEIYYNPDLSQIKLNPERLAKTTKITFYAFNGQSPFPGVGELVVK